jgi:hypothetical protein
MKGLKQNKFSLLDFYCTCECGKEHQIPNKLVNMKHVDSDGYYFKEKFICENCERQYDFVCHLEATPKRKFILYGTIMSIVLLFLFFKYDDFLDNYERIKKETELPSNVEELNDKQSEDFQEWLRKNNK